MKGVPIRSFSLSVFSSIWTGCGELHGKSPYLVQIQKYCRPKNLRIWTIFKQYYVEQFFQNEKFYLPKLT